MNEDLKNDLRDFVDEMVSDLGGVDEVIRVQCVELQKLIAHMVLFFSFEYFRSLYH